jgi:hypothetical protein
MGILDQTVTTWVSPAQDTAELQDTNSDLADLPALVIDDDEDDDSTLTSHKSNPNRARKDGDFNMEGDDDVQELTDSATGNGDDIATNNDDGNADGAAAFVPTNGTSFELGIWMPILDTYNPDGSSVCMLVCLLFVCRDWSAIISLSRLHSQCLLKAIIPTIPAGLSLQFPYPTSFPVAHLPRYSVFAVNDQVFCSVLDGTGRVVISGSTILTMDSYEGHGDGLEFAASFSQFDYSNIWIPTLRAHWTEEMCHERCIAIANEMRGYSIICVRERRTAAGRSVLKLILFEPIVLSPSFVADVNNYYHDLENDMESDVSVCYESFSNDDNCCARVTVCYLYDIDGYRLVDSSCLDSGRFWIWEGNGYNG